MKIWSWSDLGRSWGGLGRSWGDLGWSWGGLWGVLGRLGAVLGGSWTILGGLGALLGGSWSLLGRSKNDQKIDPKLDSKTGRIATEKNRSGATPTEVSEVEKGQPASHDTTRKCYQSRYRYD